MLLVLGYFAVGSFILFLIGGHPDFYDCTPFRKWFRFLGSDKYKYIKSTEDIQNTKYYDFNSDLTIEICFEPLLSLCFWPVILFLYIIAMTDK